MTEPGAGSDLASIATTADRDGDHYVVNGAKTFISNGFLCDLCLVAAKHLEGSRPAQGHSLALLRRGEAPAGLRQGQGSSRRWVHGRRRDTSELAFEDCRVPAANRIGEQGMGFLHDDEKAAAGAAHRRHLRAGQAPRPGAASDTIAYTQERKAFGKPISKFQNTQFKLVECATQVEVGRAFLDRLLEEHVAGKHLRSRSARWPSSLADRDARPRVVDEWPAVLRRLRVHARVPCRAGVHGRRASSGSSPGTNEIAKVIIAKQLGL